MKILEVNNIDLIGKRFNGYDLAQELSSNEMQIQQMVVIKQSDDDKVKRILPISLIETFYNLENLQDEILSIKSMVSLTTPALLESNEYKECDIIHFHMFHNTNLSLYSLLEIAKSKKIIISLHDPWFFTGHCVHFQDCSKWKNGCKNCPDLKRMFSVKSDTSNEFWNLKKKIFDLIDVDIVVSSPWMYKLATSSPITKNKRIHLIPFGIDTDYFFSKISKKEARKKLGIDEDGKVLFFRSQREFKGTEYIVDALKNLNYDGNITLITCSEVGNLKSIENNYKIVELGNATSDQIILAYNCCDLFLMPSIGESFGMMAIEAMSCERPVIIFDNTALPSVTFAPKCGILVKNKDSIDLKKKIYYYLCNPKEVEKRGKLARKIVKENYSEKKYLNNIKMLYEFVNQRKLEPPVIKDSISSASEVYLKKKLNEISNSLFKKEKDKLNYVLFDIKEKSNFEKEYIEFSNFSIQSIISDYNQKIYLLLNNRLSTKITLWQKLKNILKKTPLYPLLRKIKYMLLK